MLCFAFRRLAAVTVAATAALSWADTVAPDAIWSPLDAIAPAEEQAEPWVRPQGYTPVRIDLDAARNTLAAAPMEAVPGRPADALVMTLPDPDGNAQRFRVVEAPVMAPELQARYPQIRTYLAYGVDDPFAVARIAVTPAGFDAQVRTPNGTWYIDRYNRDDTSLYTSYRRTDYRRPISWICEVAGGAAAPVDAIAPVTGNALLVGEQLRTYTLAVATTGEYTSFHGGTVASGLAAVVTSVNRITGIYETDVSVRLVLAANNDALIFTNAGSDPWSNNSGDLNSITSQINSRIGSGAYDIGHLYQTSGGGVAGLGVVCGSSKGRGLTGLPSPIGDVFWVDYAAHEMGHQFGANHTFNGTNGSCSGGNRNGSTAYEPGSGNTIMAYAGICGADNTQSVSDPHFHSVSLTEIRNLVTGFANSCATITNTGNADPTVDAGPNRAVPTRTPFRLTATSSDPNGDPVAYAWEQRDLGPAQALSASDNGSSPLFRSFDVTPDPARDFPRLSDTLAQVSNIREKLPTQGRTMDFRVIARDGRGGVATDDIALNVVSGTGPFDVTAPAAGEDLGGGTTVQWTVNGTNAAPINAANVNILLSTDGGQTFPTILASNTPNDGAEFVAFPAITTSSARVKVEPTDNYFYDINPGNFSITVVALSGDFPSGRPDFVDPGVATDIPVRFINGSETLDPASPTLFVSRNAGPFQPSPMTPAGGNDYTATLPAFACDDTFEYYVSAATTQGTQLTIPADAPSASFTAGIGEFVTPFADNFQTNQGWTVSGNPSTGGWDRGVPGNFGRNDPPSDSDGSGQCYVTGNSTNEDVDGGSTVLLSPALDTTGGGELSFDYWYDGFNLASGDALVVEISFNNGANWVPVQTTTNPVASWRTTTVPVDAALGTDVTRLRFTAADPDPGGVVEAGVDNVRVTAFVCDDPNVGCNPADIASPFGELTFGDISAFLAAFSAQDPVADIASPFGEFTFGDISTFVAAFDAGCP
jgi:hypothetical protein